ncbi:hypothetical protein F511_38827 [Dorcoceras hygrometricum]|uniref:Uncharacterized protein n=1 Tax=Dorcoceras hygrometricum TaxID=472368 RepID=A0A2Z7CR62_9LAMI|nr:hypothetical protein F511_38827 [Dorcoceras hygrometricum]
MSLFDLQDVCIAIGSIATLDLPMVVDLIGIYGLKGPYSTAAAARRRRKFVFGQLDEENPFVQNSSVLLVQADEGVLVLVVDRIGDIYRSLPRRADVIVTTIQNQNSWNWPPAAAACGGPPDRRTSTRGAMRVGDRTPHRASTALDARPGRARPAPPAP